MKTLILGLGNPILSDDGIGVHVARVIRRQRPELDVLEASAAGFRVVDEMLGYDRVILIDAIVTGKMPVGSVFELTREQFRNASHYSSPHDMGLFEAFELMKKHGAKLPEELIIIAIEVKDIDTFSENFTPQVEEALPEAVRIALSKLPTSECAE